MTDTTLRILIVEDEEPMRLALGDALREEGHEVLTAADGESGLALALSEAPDLVLLDLMLPGRDGFSVLKAMREDKLESAVIILSARGEEWDRVQGFEYGADDYIVKPFSMKELLLRVRAAEKRAEGGTPGMEGSAGKARFVFSVSDYTARESERPRHALGGDVIVGRADSARREDVVIVGSGFVDGGDDNVFDVGDYPGFANPNSPRSERQGEVFEIDVLRSTGQNFIADDQDACGYRAVAHAVCLQFDRGERPES